MVKTIAAFILAASLPAFGDFSYEQTSKITGGAMAGMMKVAGVFSKQAREPIVSTVAVKGNRMVHWNPHSASVTDLDKETITSINFDKKQYSVMTFAQMKQMMEEMSQKMKSSPDAQKADVQFKVSVKDTGQKKTIAGFDTHEMIITMEMEGTDKESGAKGGMVISSDIWLAPKAAGYNEISDFYKRMGEKLAWAPGDMGMFGARPDISKGMAEIYKESAKLDGMPVFQTIKMGVQGQPQSGQAAGAQSSQQQQQPPPQQQADKPSLGGLLGGRLGGFGRKKKSQDESASEASTAPQGSGDASGSLMEMTSELSSFSANSVDESKFEVPAGFKQVEPDMARHHGR